MNYDKHSDKSKHLQIDEYRYYTVEDLFCCGYAPYFWEAVRLRYPEYCN